MRAPTCVLAGTLSSPPNLGRPVWRPHTVGLGSQVGGPVHVDDGTRHEIGASEAKNATVRATSIAVATRPRGLCQRIPSPWGPRSRAAAMSVSTKPEATT